MWIISVGTYILSRTGEKYIKRKFEADLQEQEILEYFLCDKYYFGKLGVI